MINIIAAISKNNVLGGNNTLLWHLPSDLKRFKKLTTGSTVIMGRKTFESIGKPLPNRKNIVVSRTKLSIDGVDVVDNISDALTDDCFIIGGGQIYEKTIDIADKIYLTVIDSDFKGDTFFPVIGDDWKITSVEWHKPDKKNKYNYSFIIYEKK